MATGLWAGMEKTQVFERGNYVKGGFRGVVEIKKTLVKTTRASGIAFIVEMQVIETNMPDAVNGHPVGQKVSWFQKMTDIDVAFPAIKEWAAACVGVNPSNKAAVESEVSPHIETAMEQATTSPTDNGFIGIKVFLETTQIETKNGRPFTRHSWTPIPQGDGVVGAA